MATTTNNTEFNADDACFDLPVHWVADEGSLAELVAKIGALSRVALDTEFIKRSTFYPILALVQVNTGEAIYLLDAPSLDLGVFWQALRAVPEMIWYACGEDLGIFYWLSGCPPLENVIDVQMGVAYLTGNLQVGYSRAVSEFLGVHLPKTESQSDWLVRPLSEEQKDYAVDDVRYLLKLHDVVEAALSAKNLLAFAKEDTTVYAKELYEAWHTPSSQAYLEMIASNYNHEQITVLQALAAWRDELAKKLNQPRTFIISKQAMREIVQFLPEDTRSLARTTLHRASLRRYGNDIIAVIKKAKSLPETARPPMPIPTYTSKDKPFKNELKAEIKTYSEKTGVPENLVLKNRWVDELLWAVVSDEPLKSEALLGYRKTWLVAEVLPLLSRYKEDIRLAMMYSEKSRK